MSADLPITPKFRRGETVTYTDNHGRTKKGKVIRIDATWPRTVLDSPVQPPSLSYTVTHPSYTHRMATIDESKIWGSE